MDSSATSTWLPFWVHVMAFPCYGVFDGFQIGLELRSAWVFIPNPESINNYAS